MKRFLALFLCFALCLTLIPAASAEDIEIADEPLEAAVPADEVAEPADEPEPEAEIVIEAPAPADEIVIEAPAAEDEVALADEPETAPIPDEAEPDDFWQFSWEIWNGYDLQIWYDVPDYGPGEAPWYQYRDEITSISFMSSCQSIGDCAFYGMDKVVGLTMVSDHVFFTDIGEYAFYGCSSLRRIRIDGSESVGSYAFANCSSLEEVYILGEPKIGYQAFSNCGSPEICFYSGVPDFNEYCFGGTTAKAWYPFNGLWSSSDLKNYGGTLTWTKGYHGQLGDYQSNIAWDLSEDGYLRLTGTGEADRDSYWNTIGVVRDLATSLYVGEGITVIYSICDGFSKLSYVSLPDTLTDIRYCSFRGCTSLTSIEIPANVTVVGASAFENCTSLREVHFRGLYTMFMAVLKETEDDLNSIFVNVTATVYYPPAGAWDEDVRRQYGGTLTWVCDDKVGDNVTWSASGRKLILTGSGDTWDYNNGWPGFYYMRDQWTVLEIDSRITKIGAYLFYGMEYIQLVEIPASVTSIGKYAFARMPSLDYLVFKGHAPARDTDAFKGDTATVYYPPVYSWNDGTMTGYGGNFTWVCDDKVSDSVTWYLSIYGKLTLSGSGSTGDWPSEYPDFYAFKNEVKEIEVGPGITELGSFLFYNMGSTKKLTLPRGLQNIGSSACRYCSALTDIVFKGHAPTIAAASFGDVTASVTYYPLYSWNSDTKQDYGGTLSWVCDDKIGANTNWELFSNGTLWIGGSGATDDFPSAYPAFYNFREECGSVVIGSSVTKLGTYLLYGMDSTTDVTANEGLATISDYAFGNMSALKWIRFKGNAPTFASNCFHGVTATARYHSSKSGWTPSVMKDYEGHITWVDIDEGYSITLTDYTKGAAQTSLNLSAGYSGSVTFTVSADWPVVVAVKRGEEYTAIKCTTVGSEHRFTLTVTGDTELVFAFKGDVNLDGAVKSSEVTMIKRVVAGTYNLKNGMAALAADVNGDGSVKSSDATMLARSIAGTYDLKW